MPANTFYVMLIMMTPWRMICVLMVWLLAARAEHIAGAEELGLAVGNFAMKHPRLLTWGGMDATLERLFQNDPVLEKMGSMPFVEFLVRLENRGIILDYLEGLPDRVVQNILQCRTLTNTVLFPPASSTSGQAMETALALAGLVGGVVVVGGATRDGPSKRWMSTLPMTGEKMGTSYSAPGARGGCREG